MPQSGAAGGVTGYGPHLAQGLSQRQPIFSAWTNQRSREVKPRPVDAITGVRNEYAMESIYYVMCWACHRKCRHCYEDRFRPYLREDLAQVVDEARRNFPHIVDNLPERMTYLDRDEPGPAGVLSE